MRGDIIFYTPDSLIGRIIARASHGPFCHVAVDTGPDVIAADWPGVAHYPLPAARQVKAVHPPPDSDIEAGMTFLEQEIGAHYGVFDIVDAFLRLTLHFTFYIGRPRQYDCSDLVTRYLIACGQEDFLGPLAQEPHLVTPNDLARLFHL